MSLYICITFILLCITIHIPIIQNSCCYFLLTERKKKFSLKARKQQKRYKKGSEVRGCESDYKDELCLHELQNAFFTARGNLREQVKTTTSGL